MRSEATHHDVLAHYIPFLRRHARALTGSQTSGDAFVRATLEAILQAPARFTDKDAPRVELFHLFHGIWDSVAESGGFAHLVEVEVERPSLGEGLLQRLPRTRREAFLLTAIEGFSVADTAIILDRDPTEVIADIDSARRDIASGMSSRIIIIEDEPVIAMHLQDIVEDMGHTVVGIASTHMEAVAVSARASADLILADIRLADGSTSGLDAVRDILAKQVLPVIFITAFPERLLTGDCAEPIYLITKPFDADTVVATVGQALLVHREFNS